MFFAPALPLAVVKDPTGAGDTFAGGFMGYLAKTGELNYETLKTGIIYGSAMASFCVEEFSLERMKNLTQDDISNRVAQFVNMSQFTI
jgi:sugar/nucleoside kinase (ribokinase family)